MPNKTKLLLSLVAASMFFVGSSFAASITNRIGELHLQWKKLGNFTTAFNDISVGGGGAYIYATTKDAVPAKLYYSRDYGKSWEHKTLTEEETKYYSTHVYTTDIGNEVYASFKNVLQRGIYDPTTNQWSWKVLKTFPKDKSIDIISGDSDGSLIYVIAGPRNPNHLLYVSRDHGDHWKLQTPGGYKDITTVDASYNGDIVYVGASKYYKAHWFASYDGGQTWHELLYYRTTDTPAVDIWALSVSRFHEVFATNCEDFGTLIIDKTKIDRDKLPVQLDTSPQIYADMSGNIYVAGGGSKTYPSGLVVSRNGGQTWEYALEGVRVNGMNFYHNYCGTSAYLATLSGLYIGVS